MTSRQQRTGKESTGTCWTNEEGLTTGLFLVDDLVVFWLTKCQIFWRSSASATTDWMMLLYITQQIKTNIKNLIVVTIDKKQIEVGGSRGWNQLQWSIYCDNGRGQTLYLVLFFSKTAAPSRVKIRIIDRGGGLWGPVAKWEWTFPARNEYGRHMEIHEAGTEVLENKGFLCVFLLPETVRLSDQ